jgi:hypothetical protein
MIFELSILDLMGLMGEDASNIRKLMEQHSFLKERYEKKEAYSSESLKTSKMLGYVYALEVLEGRAALVDSPEQLGEKLLKAGWVRKTLINDCVAELKKMPAYLLKDITIELNKELKIK